ncbi:MAG TPA: hypothetical protein VMB85_15445 [Bryobacteraceae bacterium]|nr:hypothetical protein [Bryobacteraceae bacterium]
MTETLDPGTALNEMNDCIVENVKLQFARQLYETSLERHGPDHEQTRSLREYIAELEKRESSS